YWIEKERGESELVRREIQRVEEALDILILAALKGRQSRSSTRQTRVCDFLKAHHRGPLTREDVRIATDVVKLAFRRVASGTNERTFITAILPPSVFAGNTINYLVPWQFDAEKAITNLDSIKACFKPALPSSTLVYLCGIFNSFTIDYVLRFKI